MAIYLLDCGLISHPLRGQIEKVRDVPTIHHLLQFYSLDSLDYKYSVKKFHKSSSMSCTLQQDSVLSPFCKSCTRIHSIPTMNISWQIYMCVHGRRWHRPGNARTNADRQFTTGEEDRSIDLITAHNCSTEMHAPIARSRIISVSGKAS